MKKVILFITISLGFLQLGNAQKKIVIAKYSLFPYSSEYLTSSKELTEEEKSFNLALRRTKEFKYTFLSDLKSKQAVFYLDSIITRKVKGKEDYWIKPEDVVSYAFREGGVNYAKEEEFGHIFYIYSKDFDYKWKIVNESKKINGVMCQKAISNINGNKIIAWFSKDIPISYGPLNFFGLPGLIIQVENFFNTITLEKLEYSNDNQLLNDKLEYYQKLYNQDKKDSEIKNSIFLLKKGELIQNLKQMM